jgi:hypothetical protein
MSITEILTVDSVKQYNVRLEHVIVYIDILYTQGDLYCVVSFSAEIPLPALAFIVCSFCVQIGNTQITHVMLGQYSRVPVPSI